MALADHYPPEASRVTEITLKLDLYALGYTDSVSESDRLVTVTITPGEAYDRMRDDRVAVKYDGRTYDHRDKEHPLSEVPEWFDDVVELAESRVTVE